MQISIKDEIDKEIKAYREQEAKDKRFAPDILKSVWQEFQPDVEARRSVTILQIRERLKRIFQAYGIPFKEYGKKGVEKVYFKLTNQTIEDYFQCIPSNSILSGSYRFIAMKPELVQKIEESI